MMSLLFNMLSKFVIDFFQASFNFMDAVTVCNDFGAQENKISYCFHFSPLTLPIKTKINNFRIIMFMLYNGELYRVKINCS